MTDQQSIISKKKENYPFFTCTDLHIGNDDFIVIFQGALPVFTVDFVYQIFEAEKRLNLLNEQVVFIHLHILEKPKTVKCTIYYPEDNQTRGDTIYLDYPAFRLFQHWEKWELTDQRRDREQINRPIEELDSIFPELMNHPILKRLGIHSYFDRASYGVYFYTEKEELACKVLTYEQNEQLRKQHQINN